MSKGTTVMDTVELAHEIAEIRAEGVREGLRIGSEIVRAMNLSYIGDGLSSQRGFSVETAAALLRRAESYVPEPSLNRPNMGQNNETQEGKQ